MKDHFFSNERYLNFDGLLRGEHALGVVVGRPELDALFGDLGKLQQADHL